MLKRNYLITKLFLALYLVSIYVKYMYICVHMCIMNLHVSVGGYVFLCFSCYLGLKIVEVIGPLAQSLGVRRPKSALD